MSGAPIHFEETEGEIRAALGQETGQAGDGWTLETVGVRRQVVRANHPDGERSLAVKWCELAEVARAEWTGLVSLRRGTAPLVEPVFLAGRVLATAWLDAPRADTMLLRSPRRQRAECLRQAGEWLAALHANATRRRVSRDFRNVCSQLRRRFKADRRVAADGLLHALDQRARRIGSVERDGVPLHWDFKPHNLFLTGRGIVGFDVGSFRVGLPMHDAASFLTAVELERYQAEVRGVRPAGTVDADRRAFFRGYGALDAEDAPLLDMIEDQLLVGRWLRHGTVFEPPVERVVATARALAARGLPEGGTATRPGRLVRRARLWPRWSDRFGP